MKDRIINVAIRTAMAITMLCAARAAPPFSGTIFLDPDTITDAYRNSPEGFVIGIIETNKEMFQ